MAMMGAAVVLFGSLTVVNLILTYGVIRRLREQGELLARGGGSGLMESSVRDVVQPFSIIDTDGREISRDTLQDGTIVGFFAPGCPPCEDLLPRFIEGVRASGRPRGQVLAVLAGGKSQQDYAGRLAPVATVIVGEYAETMVAAFGVRGFPVICRVGLDGSIEEIERDLKALREPVPA